MILLVYKKSYFNTNDLDYCIPSVCVSLLQDFKDIFLDEIPSELSLIRRIKHQINLVPRAFIHNQLAYRSSHKKTKKLQRQVEELMTKGFIREYKSMCNSSVVSTKTE
jgi:hypothetical protein